jgi:hypothetical protein
MNGNWRPIICDRDITGRPVKVAKVVTGIPRAPKATGVVSNISVYVRASIGSKLQRISTVYRDE